MEAVCSSGSTAAAQHRYLLVQHPHVGHLPLVVLVQPPQLLAHLLHVVVLPDQLDVVLSHRLQLVLQLGVLAGEAAVQGAGETPERAPSWIKSRVLQELVNLLRKTFFKKWWVLLKFFKRTQSAWLSKTKTFNTGI